MTQDSTPRRYTLRIEVEVRDQDDFVHFQSNTVTGHAPQLGVEWVSANDAEALEGFFRFFLNWSHVKDSSDTLKGVREIVQRALQGDAEVERLRAELVAETWYHKAADATIQSLMDKNAAAMEIVQEVADYPEYQDEDGWLAVLRAKSQGIFAESEGSTDAD